MDNFTRDLQDNLTDIKDRTTHSFVFLTNTTAYKMMIIRDPGVVGMYDSLIWDYDKQISYKILPDRGQFEQEVSIQQYMSERGLAPRIKQTVVISPTSFKDYIKSNWSHNYSAYWGNKLKAKHIFEWIDALFVDDIDKYTSVSIIEMDLIDTKRYNPLNDDSSPRYKKSVSDIREIMGQLDFTDFDNNPDNWYSSENADPLKIDYMFIDFGGWRPTPNKK